MYEQSRRACRRELYDEEKDGPVQLHFDVPENEENFFIELPDPAAADAKGEILVFIHSWLLLDDLKLEPGVRQVDARIEKMALADRDQVDEADACELEDHTQCEHGIFGFSGDDIYEALALWHRLQSVRWKVLLWSRYAVQIDRPRSFSDTALNYLGPGRYGVKDVDKEADAMGGPL